MDENRQNLINMFVDAWGANVEDVVEYIVVALSDMAVEELANGLDLDMYTPMPEPGEDGWPV